MGNAPGPRDSASLGLYLHIPFCVQKCLYCDFATAPYRAAVVPAFLAALREEASRYASVVSDRVTSVYFGGGTPSLLEGRQLLDLMRHLRLCFDIASDAEITLEANPGTMDAAKLDAFRLAGANRLSLGAQVFDDSLLMTLGREHSAADTDRTFELARKAGFDNVNLDLIFGLPSQSRANWRDTVHRALELGPEHVSTYGLTVEPKTVFALLARKGELRLPSEEDQAFMYEWTNEGLESAGYVHYEISNFALAGRECRHNRTYWQNEPYIGLGPGAWGYLGGERYGNVRGVRTYMNRIRDGLLPVEERERLEGRAARAEALMLALRMREGIDLATYERRYGAPLVEDFRKEIALLVEWELVEWSPDSPKATALRLTRKGFLYSNEVFVRLV